MKFFLPFCLLLLVACSSSEFQADSRPNILLIVLDDLGYSDFSCYGSEIPTPNIDALAASGQRFANFCASPMCAPSRAMLLSGNDNHIEGMGRMITSDRKHIQYKGLPHYEEDISDRVVFFPKLLQKAGYYTSMAGKWHLGWEASSDPYLNGFEDTWALLNGFANHYDNRNYGMTDIDKKRDTISLFTEKGVLVDYPTGTHCTEVYTNKIINYIQKAKLANKPFFAYLPYTAPHWPLQVDKQYSDLHKGKYDKGYQAVMQQRFEGMKAKGVIDKNIALRAYPDMPKWETLSEQEQKIQARKMEIYAGLITHVDEYIGKVVQALKDNGQYENTVIFLMSDNGSGPEEFTNHAYLGNIINDTIINSLENLGKPNSFATIGSNWAKVCTVPFRKYKGNMYEGGLNAPFIASGYTIPSSSVVRKGFFTLQDIAPTILEIAGVTYPTTWKDKPIYPMRGESVWSFIKKQKSNAHDPDFLFAMEHRDAGFVRQGDWKLVNQKDAAVNDNFELYNLSQDLSEQKDLAEKHPEKVKTLLNDWEKFKEEVGVIFIRD